MGRRSEHTLEQQREMALAAAELILVQKGQAALSMRKVAEAIGYTVGQLYLLFENQDDLLATLNERTADAIHAHLSDALHASAAADPAETMRALAAAYIGYAHRNPHRFRLLFEHVLPEALKPRPSADARIERLFALVEGVVSPLLRGRVSKLAPRTAAATLWSGIHGVCMLAVSGKLSWSGEHDFRPFSDLLVTAFLRGLSAEPRTRVIKPSSGRHRA